MRLRETLLAAAALVGLMRAGHADGVDDYLKAQMTTRHIPGLSVAVVKDGQVAKAQSYGLANVELSVPAAADTIYPVGSISKQFTAVGVMLLVQDQKVGLDDPVSKYLDALPQTWQNITVRELLNQTSGIPEWVPNPDKDPLLKTYSLPELARHAAIKPLAFKPGTQFGYSNTNYNLLAGIVEKASGKPLSDFLEDRLFKPLRMEATEEYDPQMAVQHRAAGYTCAAGKIYNNILFYDSSIYDGAGGLQSTVDDLAKWDAAVASGKVLPLSVMAQMWTPPTLPGGALTKYGMGWSSQTINRHPMIWHNGELPGCTGFLAHFPNDHLTVVILSNMNSVDGSDDGPPFLSLGLGVAAQYVPALAPAKEAAGIPDTDPKTAALLRIAAAQIAAGGSLDLSLVAPAVQAGLTPAVLKPLHDLLAPLGPITALTLLRRGPDGSAVYRARYKAVTVNWLIAVDKDHKITLIYGQGAPP